MKKKKILTDLVITNLTAEGNALARHEGKVIFVENAVPGDIADVLLLKNKTDYALGKIMQLKQPSPQRIAPFCEHFGTCGGCKWQYLPYSLQLQYKQEMVEEALRRVGKLDLPLLLPIIGASPNTYYRNKMDYTFSNRRWLTTAEVAQTAEHSREALGFHVAGMFDRVVDIQHCFLQAEPSNAIRNEIRQYALAHQLSFYDVKTHTGFLRNLIIRNTTLGELMVLLSFGYEDVPCREALLAHIRQQFPEITCLLYVINPKKNETLYDLDIQTYFGNPTITEQLGEVRYSISPKSFFQTNSRQAQNLYQVVRDFCQLSGNEIVYDLYTGTGSIALYLAHLCKQVIGIEEVQQAIDDAHINAQLNGIENARFFAGDVRAMLTDEFAQQHAAPDVLVTDPPRAGMHPDVVRQLLRLLPPRIVYVSCNPVTQARDLQLLAAKYKIKKVQPVDMFPHTYHVENVALLELDSIE